MSGKRILILTNRAPHPLKDGGNLAVKAMIDGYHSNGWQVYLLSMNTTRHYVPEKTLQRAYHYIHACEMVEVDNDLHIWPVIQNYLFGTEPNHVQRFRHEGYKKRLAQVLESFKPDVVQIESIYLSQYLPVIKQQENISTVLRLHNIEYQVWDRLASETKQPLKRRYLENLAQRIRKYEEEVWKEYDVLLPITHTDETVVKNIYSSVNTYVVPFGIDINIPVQAVQEKWVAYHIGAMDWLPNVEAINWLVKKAWPLINQQCPDLELYLAGRNMPQRMRQSKVPNVHFQGEVPDAQAFIADKKILIVPVQSGGGIRVKTLEAMAMGKIVISTTVGIQGIEAADKIHYLRADTDSELAHVLAWCLTNKDAAEEIGRNAQKLVKEQHDAIKLATGLSTHLQHKTAKTHHQYS